MEAYLLNSTLSTRTIAPSTSGTQASVSGTTNETTLATISLNANQIKDKTIKMILSCSSTNTLATSRTWRVRLGGIGGTVLGQFTQSGSAASYAAALVIRDRSGSSQRATFFGSQSATPSANAYTATVDTTTATTIVITCQLGATAGSEQGALEFYTCEVVQ